jgi:hypothetical protein
MSKTTTLPATLIETLTSRFRAEAEAKHAQYPQYKGHWDGWGLVQVTRRVKTKCGEAFKKGEIALGKRDEPVVDPTLHPETLAQLNRPSYTVYSRSNGIDTLVRASQVVEVVAA